MGYFFFVRWFCFYVGLLLDSFCGISWGSLLVSVYCFGRRVPPILPLFWFGSWDRWLVVFRCTVLLVCRFCISFYWFFRRGRWGAVFFFGWGFVHWRERLFWEVGWRPIRRRGIVIALIFASWSVGCCNRCILGFCYTCSWSWHFCRLHRRWNRWGWWSSLIYRRSGWAANLSFLILLANY